MIHIEDKINVCNPNRLINRISTCGQLLLYSVLVGLILITIRCTHIEELLQKESPRETYLKALYSSPVATTDIWQQWIDVGDSALIHPILIEPPYQHQMIYFPDQPDAWSWRIEVSAGRKLEFICSPGDTSHQLFIDLYTINNEGMELVSSSKDTILTYETKKDETLVFRFQPELLILGQATFSLRDFPVLGFPVEGGRQSDIGSFWGDPRDGGDRRHEGVDIFATRGTPVIAASEGRIHKTGNGGLGGKTIWVRSGGKSLYYAHLDSINVHPGQFVRTGDTIGFVGNTGNARTTPPHLHFGVYARGATNPLPFISQSRNKIAAFAVNISPDTRWGKIITNKANVRPAPSTEEQPVASLSRNEIIGIKGVVNGWYEVFLPEGDEGFIHNSLISFGLTPFNEIEAYKGDSLFYPLTGETFFEISDPQKELLGYGVFGDRFLTRYKNHWVGAVQVRSD